MKNWDRGERWIERGIFAVLLALMVWLISCAPARAQVVERSTYTNAVGVQTYYLLQPDRVYLVLLRIRDNEWYQPGGFDMRGEPFASAWVLEPEWDWPAEDMIVQDVTAAVAWYESLYGPWAIPEFFPP